MDPEPRTAVSPVLLAVIVAFVAAAVFTPALGGGWLWDDQSLIAKNPFVHSLASWPRWLDTDFWDVNQDVVRFGHRIVYWRPLVTTSYALDWQLGGGSPVWFHLTNLLWQALAGALAFFALRRWIGSDVPAFAAALLFAVHPTKAESVAWIAGRTDVLCVVAMFVASAGIARRLRGQRLGLALEIAGTIAAYMCKEQAIVLPVFAAIEAWVFAGRPVIDLSSIRKIAWTAAPQVAIVVGYLVARALLLPLGSDVTSQGLPFVDYVLAIFDTFGRFFELTFIPHDLSVQQGLLHVAHGELVHSMPHVIAGAIGLAGFATVAIWARKRWPVVTVGIAFYIAALLPTANLRNTEMITLVSERFLYLPVLGLALIAGALLARADRTWSRRTSVVCAIVCIAASVLSLRRAHDFGNVDRFWARELSLHPDSYEARNFALEQAIETKKYKTALALLVDLKAASDLYGSTYDHEVEQMIQIAAMVGRLTPDHDVTTLRAIDRFCDQLLEPKTTLAELRAGTVAMTISTKPGNDPKNLFRARVLALRADLHGRLGDDPAAVAFAARARDICAGCMKVALIEAIAYGRAGDYDRGFAALDRVAREVQETPIEETRAALEKSQRAQRAAAMAQGPARLQAQASQLGALELWGRAYDVLAPYKDEIKKAPKIAFGFAELAFRAGETAVAREVLAGFVAPAEVDERLKDWARKMGWTE